MMWTGGQSGGAAADKRCDGITKFRNDGSVRMGRVVVEWIDSTAAAGSRNAEWPTVGFIVAKVRLCHPW